MTNDTEITPALPPDDWKFYRHPSRHGLYESLSSDHAVMALANAALPDDDPRKITRADVEWVNRKVQTLLDSPDYMRSTFQPSIDAGGALAAKLAALLPPE